MELRKLAFDVAELMNINHPFDKDMKMAGHDWVTRFLKRHPEIRVRTPEPTSISRLGGFRRSEVELFFQNLEKLNDKHGYGPTHVYNMDETGVPTTVPGRKILAGKGSRQVGIVTSAEKGQTTTAVCCCNAAGVFIPPQLIFARKRMNESLKRGAPPGTIFATSDSGWATKDTFVEWLRHFIKVTGATVKNRVLLIVDNHTSHVSIEALTLCEESGVDILTLPPHTSHRLQPLDVAVFGPLKTWYKDEIHRWLRKNPGQRVTQHQVSEVFGAAYLKAAAPRNAVNGFKASGIMPFDDQVFSDEDFVAAIHVLADRTVQDGTGAQDDDAGSQGDAPERGATEDEETARDRADAMGEAVTAQGDVSGAKGKALGDESNAGAKCDGDCVHGHGDGTLPSCSNGTVDTGAPPELEMPAEEAQRRQVSHIAQILMEATSSGKVPVTSEILNEILSVPKPTPREVKRRVKSQRSVILTSSPVKRALVEKEKNTAGREKRGKKKAKTPRKQKVSHPVDICIFCGESVVGVNEIWLQCSKCQQWCHEACSGGGSSAFICDFCK